MSTTGAALLTVCVTVAVLAMIHLPFGDYMARVYSDPKHWRVERGLYRLAGVDPDRDQTWGVYARSVLAFSAVSVLFLYLQQRVQGALACRRCAATACRGASRSGASCWPPRTSRSTG